MALQLLEPLLWLQLALLVARQANDFLGLQWLAVLVNFVAILVSIGALFGHRALHFFFQFPLFVYNLFSCLAHNQWPSGQWTRALHLDTGARPFAFHVLRDHVLWSEARAERVAALAESVQSSVHLILSSALILAHLLYYRRRRLKLRKNNSKSIPRYFRSRDSLLSCSAPSHAPAAALHDLAARGSAFRSRVSPAHAPQPAAPQHALHGLSEAAPEAVVGQQLPVGLGDRLLRSLHARRSVQPFIFGHGSFGPIRDADLN